MKAFAKRFLAALGYRVQGTRYIPRQLLEPAHLRSIELVDVISRRMFEFGPELTFVQIGAFDGITKDPLRPYIERYGWRGVLVEPQPQYAEKLRELYASDPRLVVVQAAVDQECGQRTLYTVVSQDAPLWAAGMASFQRDHLIRNAYLVPGLEKMIREISVDCISFDEVLRHVPPGRLDLLQIDAEGADALILSLFPFDRVKPAIVHWEIKNLSIDEREECFDLLLSVGYRLAPSGEEDMMAILV